jgi:hypothetical protein
MVILEMVRETTKGSLCRQWKRFHDAFRGILIASMLIQRTQRMRVIFENLEYGLPIGSESQHDAVLT